ncbi:MULTISPECIES: alpha/beta hydrolase [Pseudoalteromonas]|nr:MULTISPECIES: alpha/beta hydrolase [Pseudoalteromonas]
MKRIIGLLSLCAIFGAHATPSTIDDKKRNRTIPLEITMPTNETQCTAQTQCKVAFINAGYRVEHDKYQFISKLLNQRGYLTVAIAHELPGDPPLSITGKLFETRQENWLRGTVTIAVVHEQLKQKYPHYNFDQLMLIGHSNGGDISSLLASQKVSFIKDIITLDHRRVPLPRTRDIRVLSIRASDYPADPGVLPTLAEQQKYQSCVVTIDKSRHNDMSDYGPQWLKTRINRLIELHLDDTDCEALKAI